MPLEGPKPKEGDLIEFLRPEYQHWGVYVGNGEVVHFIKIESGGGSGSWGSSSGSSSTALAGDGAVLREFLEDVAAGSVYRVNNKYDRKKKPKDPKEIVQAALNEAGKRKPYNLTTYNCEHFATHLRHGVKMSAQAKTGLFAAGGVIAASTAVAGVVGSVAAVAGGAVLR